MTRTITPASTEPAAPAFSGWLRTGRGRPWQRACTAASEAEAFRELQAAAAAYRHVDLLVLPADTDPNRRPAR